MVLALLFQLPEKSSQNVIILMVHMTVNVKLDIGSHTTRVFDEFLMTDFRLYSIKFIPKMGQNANF